MEDRPGLFRVRQLQRKGVDTDEHSAKFIVSSKKPEDSDSPGPSGSSSGHSLSAQEEVILNLWDAVDERAKRETTADHDDRVVPSHTLKYAAQLYHYLKKPEVKLIQRNPVIARVETDAGHGAGKPRDKVIDELSDIMSFLQRVLQLKWYTMIEMEVK
uniref:Prolyl endopeptidase n=1 Tax=Globodera rostochiensis TaxID=31243 RepID=A0A914I1H4_GLORO